MSKGKILFINKNTFDGIIIDENNHQCLCDKNSFNESYIPNNDDKITCEINESNRGYYAFNILKDGE